MSPETGAEEVLRRVQHVTAASLAHLSLADLADELLLRVRELLDADTAVILLADPDRRALVATAAKGLEEEVERGVRVPMGRGFAGTIAASGKPVILKSVGPNDVVNPILINRGIRSMLGVPLIADGDVIGVLHVGSLGDKTFDDADAALLQLVADRVALSIKARAQEQQRTAAETLQRTLLPSALPDVAYLDLAARYIPAEGSVVGGDWYDVFELPSGEVCIGIGDVVGRGLGAAIEMSRIRNALRAFAFVDAQPSRIVGHANELMLHFEPQAMATTLILLFRSDGTFKYANAGHLPPLVVDVGTEPHFLEAGAPGEPALGTVPFYRYAEYESRLAPGASLLLYTDGLVERRNASLETGFSEMRASVADFRGGSAEALCARFVGPEVIEDRREDDLALVAIRFLGERTSPDFDASITARPRELARLRRSLRAWLQDTGLTESEAQDVLVAAGEAIANSVEHAYGPGDQGKVGIRAREAAGVVEIIIEDQGAWRHPRGEHRGRGREIMHALMDAVTLEVHEGGTTVRMRKAGTRNARG